MEITEIFYSIQGEGRWAGLPTVFIRTTGCNLRCTYCDTQYAYEGGTNMNIKQILNAVKKYPSNTICITGGEPLLQREETYQLISKLLSHNYTIILETNGSRSIKHITQIQPRQNFFISIDIKCPSSKMHNKMDLRNLHHLNTTDQIKFVIKDNNDYTYAKNIITTHKPKTPICMQPVWGIDPAWLADKILEDGLNARLSLQIHKIIYGNKRRV